MSSANRHLRGSSSFTDRGSVKKVKTYLQEGAKLNVREKTVINQRLISVNELLTQGGKRNRLKSILDNTYSSVVITVVQR